MLEFKTVFYKNFQSVGNQGIKVDLARSMTTLVGGSNGAGKSTLLEAISYGLFGKPLKKVTMGGLINTVNQKGLVVEVTFSRNGKDYRIVRGQKPAKLELYVGDELIDQSASARDYQAKIEYVLGMDYKLFTQIVVLNKEKYVPFMDLDAASRRKVVEDILDISVFSVMNDALKERAKGHSVKVSDMTFTRERLQERILGKQRLLQEARQNVDGQVDDLKRQIALHESQYDAEAAKISIINAEIDTLSDARAKLRVLETKKSECDGISVKFKTNMSNFEKTISFYKDNETCPTCSSNIEDDVKSKHIDECNHKISEIKSTSQSLITVYQNILSDISIQNTRINRINELESELRVVNNTLRMIDTAKKVAQMTIDGLTKSVKVADIEAECATAQLDLDDSTVKLNELLKEEQSINTCKVLLKDDGIKSSVVKDYIDFINTKLNEQLCAMEFYLNITLDENFNDSINAVNKKGFTYDNLSTGQKTRVNLAIWLALLEVASIKNSVVTNILFLDEILENLDVEGVRMFMGLVKEQLPHKNTFVVTQRFDEFRDYFRSELKFKLIDGFTEIV